MTALLLKLRHFDERLLAALVARRWAPLDRAIGLFTNLGGATFTISVAGLTASGLVPGLATAGRQAAATLLFSHLVVQVLKRSISRPRPHMPVGFAFLAEPPDRFSFPSGHATAALAVALPFALILPWLPGFLLFGLALVVGLSRCYLGVHYPGDVLVGWLVAWSTFVFV